MECAGAKQVIHNGTERRLQGADDFVCNVIRSTVLPGVNTPESLCDVAEPDSVRMSLDVERYNFLEVELCLGKRPV